MLIENIYLTQTQLVLKDVDGSEVSLVLDDTLEVYTYIKDHMQELETRRQANWQEFIASVDNAEREQ